MHRPIALALALALGALEPVAAADQDARHTPPENRVPAEDPQPTGAEPLASPDLPEFGTLDVDRDATISRDEARGHAGLDAIFTECDSDRDGHLSAWEFAEAKQKLVARANS